MKIYVIALAVVIGVLGGFYGGYKVGHSSVSASTATGTNRTGGAFTGNRGGGAFGGVCPTPGATPSPGGQAVARGTVADLAGTSMTVTSTACDVKVTFDPSVTVARQVTGSTADLQDNLTVTIIGTRQPDGSILARTIQIGNAGGGGGLTGGG